MFWGSTAKIQEQGIYGIDNQGLLPLKITHHAIQHPNEGSKQGYQ